MQYRINQGRPSHGRRTALALALGLGLVGGAWAQSNSSGVIFGRVAGEPGSVIQIQNLDTGLSREIGVDADGRYRAASLPVGRYKVTLRHNGQALESRDNVPVSLGSGVDVSFATSAPAAGAKDLEGIQVIASALPAIDVSSVDSRTVLDADRKSTRLNSSHKTVSRMPSSA